MKQGYNDKMDDSLGNRDGKKSSKEQNYKDRRDEAKAMNKAEGKRAYQSVESMDKNSFDKTWAKFKADTKKAFGGKYAKGGKLSTGDRYALELAGLTGVRQSAVAKLVKDNNLSEDELLNIIVGVGRQQIKSELVVSAVIDGAKSKSNTELVKFAKSEKAMKLAKGGSINNYDWKSKPLTLRTSDWQKKINYPRYHKFNGKTYNLIYNFNSKAEALRKIKDIGMTDTILQPIKYSDGKGGGLPKYFVYVSTDSADQYANGGGVGESDDCPEYFLEVEGDTQKAYELLKKGRWFDETSTRVYNDLEDIKGFVSNDKESLSRAETYLDSKGISTSVIYNLKDKFYADFEELQLEDGNNSIFTTMYFAIQDRIDPDDGNDTMTLVETANKNALNSGLIYDLEELGKRPLYKEIAETALKNIRKFWGENIKEIYLSKIPKYIKSEMPKEPTLEDAERIADKGADMFSDEFEKKFKEYLNLMEGGFAKGYAKGGGVDYVGIKERPTDSSWIKDREVRRRVDAIIRSLKTLNGGYGDGVTRRQMEFIVRAIQNPKIQLRTKKQLETYAKGGAVESEELEILKKLLVEDIADEKALLKELMRKGARDDAFETRGMMGARKEVLDDIRNIEDGNYKKGGTYLADGGSVGVANTILKQMGGMNRLVMFAGAKKFVALPNGVSFRIGNRSINYVRITLNGRDLYDLEFALVRGMKMTNEKKYTDIYSDQLKSIFEEATGMYLSFEKGGLLSSNYFSGMLSFLNY